ncbi:MAG: hypothetical protein GY710_06205 [Desulfobacteraceae bacterium]|nr:hypothetical protein [Desulfobacteraceae bacterium]
MKESGHIINKIEETQSGIDYILNAPTMPDQYELLSEYNMEELQEILQDTVNSLEDIKTGGKKMIDRYMLNGSTRKECKSYYN